MTMLGYVALLRARASPRILAALVLPGTFAHELTHYTVGLLLGAKPCGISLWPQAGVRGWRLGSVGFRNVGLLNGAFIALAPLLLIPLGGWCLVHLSVPAWGNGHWLNWLGAGYLTATLLYAGIPSLTDIKIGGRSLVFYVTVSALCWIVFVAGHIPPW